MIVGCYTLDLYCDRDNPDGYTIADIPEHGFREFPHQFTGHTEGDCMRDAKRRGWRFKDGKSYCPKCAVTLKMARKPKSRKSDGQTVGWVDVIKAIGTKFEGMAVLPRAVPNHVSKHGTGCFLQETATGVVGAAPRGSD